MQAEPSQPAQLPTNEEEDLGQMYSSQWIRHHLLQTYFFPLFFSLLLVSSMHVCHFMDLVISLVQ